MKNLRFLVAALMMVFSASFALADVAVEGERNIYVELVNGDKFPGTKFYIQYQNYTYNMGYQPSGVEKRYLEPGKHVETGARGTQSFVYSEGKLGKLQTKVALGGAMIVHEDNVAYVLDRIQLVKKGKKGLSFELVERQLIGQDGKVIKVMEKGSLAPEGSGQWIMWLMPVVCLGGLVAFFLLRGKASGSARA